MTNIKERIVNNIGERPLCNLNPARAPKIGDFYFPLCWRCTSICISSFLAFFVINFLSIKINFSWIKLIFSLCLLIPCTIDSILQYHFNIISTNFRRLYTGVLFGVGVSLLSALLIRSA